MKRLISLLLLATLILSLAACGKEPSGTAEDTTDCIMSAPSTVDESFVYEHVIIVGIDGMGAFNVKADTPNLDRIFADGALTNVGKTISPTATAACWLSSFTGINIQKTLNVRDNPGSTASINRKYTKAVEDFPSIFSMTHDKYPDAKIGSFVTWVQLNEYCVSDEGYVLKKNPKGDDEKLKNEAVKYILEQKPTLLFLHFDSVDAKGHSVGYESEEYLAQLSLVDGYLGEIYAAIEEAGILDTTLLIVATDHGGTGTVHGASTEDAVITITVGFKGKTIAPIKDFEYSIRDLSAIIAEALDLDPSSAWKGLDEPPKIPDGLFIK